MGSSEINIYCIQGYVFYNKSYGSRLYYIDFFITATALVLYILVKHKEIEEDIMKQLGKGAKFQTLAKKYSSCPSGKKGGNLGEFKLGQMVPQFDKVAFKGAILEPHLVKN